MGMLLDFVIGSLLDVGERILVDARTETGLQVHESFEIDRGSTVVGLLCVVFVLVVNVVLL